MANSMAETPKRSSPKSIAWRVSVASIARSSKFRLSTLASASGELRKAEL